MSIALIVARYLAAVREDGDYMNDWLTHLPRYMWPSIIALGKAIAAALGV